ncbi:MAG TPA: methyl-accepting chemotaxis protein [Candidatus Solibacter sp.]|nr:methyl-accepting chemotaxis protein [Candidatus Solibacter sp.]
MKLTLGKKLSLGFGSILALVFCSGLISVLKIRDMRVLQERLFEVRVPTLDAGRMLQRDLYLSGNKVRQAILAGSQPERRADAVNRVQKAWAAIDTNLTTLTDLSARWTLQENRDRLASAKEGLRKYRQAQQESMDIAEGHGSDGVVKGGNYFADVATPVGDATAATIDELVKSLVELNKADKEQLASQSITMVWMFMLSTLASVLIGVLVAWFLSRRISTSTQEVLTQAEAIAEGDLTRDDLDVRSADELGDLTVAINKMNGSLKKMIVAITENAEHVATASEELSSTSQQITANSEETSAQANVVSQAAQNVNTNLQSVSTGSEEMTSTIQSIASNAHEAATVASNAVQTAQAANATVAKLGTSSAEIGEVIKVITSIAQQTNLLALNATIEAARAGEAGKGFAVVANEVKELAKQTAKATEDISRKITAIQTDTKGAVDAIGSITGVIGQINDISGTIATAVEEQSATTNEMTRNVADAAKGSSEITRNIDGVAQAARGTSNSAQESQKAATELAEMAEQLRALVGQFKVSSSTAAPISRPMRHMAAAAGR